MVNCPKCRHPWRNHETPMKMNEDVTLHECDVHMGMGDWCGCKEKRPAGWSNVEDVIQQVESGTRMTTADGQLDSYVISAGEWRAFRAQLRRPE